MASEINKDSFLKKIKMTVFFIISAAVLLVMDRCLENMYVYFLFDTGHRILDIFMALYMRSHRILEVIIVLVFLYYLIANQFKAKTGVLAMIIIAYTCYFLTSLYAGDTGRWLNSAEYPLMMILFVTIACSKKESAQWFFFTATIVYDALMVLNIAFILFPQIYDIISGWRADYFIAPDNLTGYPLFTGILFAFLDQHFSHAKKRLIISLVLFFANQILIQCGTALIATAIFALYLAWPACKKLFENARLILFIALSVLLCALLAGAAYAYFDNGTIHNALQNVIDIKESLYVRFVLWNGVREEIFKAPLFGHGLGTTAEFYPRPMTTLFYHSHNGYLQVLYEGGILTFGAVMAVMLFTGRFLHKTKDRKLAGIFTVIIFCELIMMQFSINAWFTWYTVFFTSQIAAMTCLCIEQPAETEQIAL